jgi:hypothetical protein
VELTYLEAVHREMMWIFLKGALWLKVEGAFAVFLPINWMELGVRRKKIRSLVMGKFHVMMPNSL